MNLRCIRIQHSSKCLLCSYVPPTTAHILNGCYTALHQGRYTWRHDSVLAKIPQGIQSLFPDSTTLYDDLDGMRTENKPPSTIPPNILSTAMRPDIVIIDLSKNVWMLELTVPTNTPTGLNQAQTRKQNKPEYSNLATDLESLGWKVNYNEVEIGSLGHFTQDTVEAVTDTLPYKHINDAISIVVRGATTAIGCSHQIFLAHKQIKWDSEDSVRTMQCNVIKKLCIINKIKLYILSTNLHIYNQLTSKH